MKLKIGLIMKIEASRPDEEADVERLRAERDELLCHWPSRGVKLDAPLMNDFARLLGDMKQLMLRAQARKRKRRK